MRKMYVLENFASQGVRYPKGKIVNIEKSLADRFEKEGFLEDALIILGVEIPEPVDLSKYVAKTEHDALVKEHKVAQDKVKELEAKVSELEKQLEAKDEPKEEGSEPVAKKTTKSVKKA